MKSAASSVRHDEFDIRDAARREARRSGVSLGQWLDGVMAERAEVLGLRLVDLDPGQRIAAIVTRLNPPGTREAGDHPDRSQPRAGLVTYDDDPAAGEGSQGDPDRHAAVDDPPQEQAMRDDTAAAPLRVPPAPAGGSPERSQARAEVPAEPSAHAGARRRHAAQRVEIESKLNSLLAALDRTPRRRDAGASADDFAEEMEPIRRRRALLSDTAMTPSWRLEKAVSEIAERQSFLERQAAETGGPGQPAPARGRVAPAQPLRAADLAREATEPVASIFTSIQGDLARIAKRLDAVHLDVTRRPAPGSDPAVQEMRTLLGELRPEGSIDGLGRQVEALSSKLDVVLSHSLPKEALSQLSQRIEEVHAELAGRLAATAAAAPVIDMAAIEQLVETALDRAGRSVATPDLRALESAVQDLADKLARAEHQQDESTALEDMRAQIGTLASRIDRSDVGLTAIVALERSLGEMFGQLGSMREASLEAAEMAARAAAEEAVLAAQARLDLASPHPASLPDAALSRMSQDVAQLRAERDDADLRLHAILTALNGSLDRVVDRLGALEQDAAEERSTVARRPVPPASRPAIPTPPAPASLDFADPLEQAVALGVAELPDPQAGRPREEPLELAIPRSTEDWDGPLFGPRERSLAFDTKAEPVGTAPDPTSFIAAARRAAQAAMQEQAHKRNDEPDSPAAVPAAPRELRARFKTGMLSNRRPLLLAAAGLVLLIGVAQVVRISLSSDEPTGSIPAGDITTPAPAPLPETAPPVGPKADAGEPGVLVDTAGSDGKAAGAPEKTASVTPPLAAPQASPGIIAKSDPTASRAPLPTMAMGPGASIAALQAAEVSSHVVPTGLPASLRTQAEAGLPSAEFEAGLRYADGRGVGRDLAAAARWFEKAAGQGLAPAAYRLGSLYEKGLGVTRDAGKAVEWYRKAAEAGNIRAMHNLAVLLAEGATGKADYPAAATWFTKAAQAGVRDSQFNLAILYARGLGVTQNLSQSYMWFAIAAAQGDQDSVKKRDEVASHLDAAALDQAKAMVAAFAPEPSIAAANDVAIPAGGWDAAARGAEAAPDVRTEPTPRPSRT